MWRGGKHSAAWPSDNAQGDDVGKEYHSRVIDEHERACREFEHIAGKRESTVFFLTVFHAYYCMICAHFQSSVWRRTKDGMKD